MIWCKRRICSGDKDARCLNARCRPPAPLPLAHSLLLLLPLALPPSRSSTALDCLDEYVDAWAHRLDRCVKSFTQPKAAKAKRNGRPALPQPLLEPAEQGVASCAPSLPSPITSCEAQADDHRGRRGGDAVDGGQGAGSAEAHHGASCAPDVLQGAECASQGAECGSLGAECALLGAECAILLEERGVRGWHDTWGTCVLGWLGQPCSCADRGEKGSLRGLVLMAEQTDKTFMTCFLARLEAHCLEVTLDTCFAP